MKREPLLKPESIAAIRKNLDGLMRYIAQMPPDMASPMYVCHLHNDIANLVSCIRSALLIIERDGEPAEPQQHEAEGIDAEVARLCDVDWR